MGEPVVQEVLVLTSDVYAAMVDRALTQAPAEACGLFTGELGTLRVDGYHPMANAADPDEAGKLYVLDGQEMLEVEAQADAAGRAVLGVMHSHTHTTAYPSPTDVADAASFDPFGAWVFVIVSLKHPDPVLRAYRILDETVSELLVEMGDEVLPAEDHG
ncbi:MAG: M67 family metallopeptidase [Actinomycetota bacterium]|nr:M67 family metallopeptidase [Actinomycetota bacterium]